MKATNPQPHSGIQAPVSGCGWYLLWCVVVTLAAPYFVNEDSRLYSPDIGTYYEVDGRMQPTAEKIWIDGRTARELNSRRYLIFGMVPVIIQFLAFVISRHLARTRSKAEIPPRPSGL